MNFISALALGCMGIGFLLFFVGGGSSNVSYDDDPVGGSRLVMGRGIALFLVGLGMILLASPAAKLG